MAFFSGLFQVAFQLIPFVAITSFSLGFLLGRITRFRRQFGDQAEHITKAIALPKDVQDRIRSLIDAGKKDEAAQVLKESTGLSLKQATTIIDVMANRGMFGGTAGGTITGAVSVGGVKNKFNFSMGNQDNAETIEQVKNLLRAGKKIEAIELYRKNAGVGLKEAKDEIERIAKEME